MAQLVVRDFEDDVKARLQRRAKRHRRSMEEEVREILDVFQATIPGLNKFDKELPDDEAAQLLNDFRQDKDSIRVWLLQGRNQFVARAKQRHT